MKFSVYDFISKLVPGGIFLLFAIMVTLPFYTESKSILSFIAVLKDFDGLLSVLAILFTYFLGYIIEALGSLITEPILWKIWGGWPIQLLLEGNTTARTTFPQKDKVLKVLMKDCFGGTKDKLSIDEIDELYYFAASVVRKDGSDDQNQRQQQYIEAYVFSRNLLTAVILAFVIVIFGMVSKTWFYFGIIIFFLFITLVIYIRIKDRALYQVRHLLNSAFRILSK